MTTLSTHDTKRSEDVRARLVLLAEDARRWERVVTKLLSLASKYTGPAGPEAATQYLVLQTLVGAYPISAERLGAYLAKAVREAKLHTSWTAPDQGYEEALQSYAAGVLADRAIMAAVAEYVGELVGAGPGERARDEAVAAHHARDPRLLPGIRALGPLARRSRQPASG